MTRPSSPKRFDVLGGPGGYLTCLPVGDARRHDRYRQWITLASVNRPLTMARADWCKGWVLRNFEVR